MSPTGRNPSQPNTQNNHPRTPEFQQIKEAFMSESYVETGPSGAVAFVGEDAVKLARAITLKSAIRMHRDTGMLMTRGATITKMLELATSITGKKYKGSTKHEDAIRDLDAWIEAMKSAMPMVVRQA